MNQSTFVVVVAVGTDHHPFDRLVAWVENSVGSHLDADSVFVQRGSSQAPNLVRSESVIPHADLMALMQSADVVVTHGGPATIRDAQTSGKSPIVVPRDPALGEHVDDHQLRYASRLDSEGYVTACRDEEEFQRALLSAVANPRPVMRRSSGADRDVTAAVAQASRILDELATRQRRRRGRRFR